MTSDGNNHAPVAKLHRFFQDVNRFRMCTVLLEQCIRGCHADSELLIAQPCLKSFDLVSIGEISNRCVGDPSYIAVVVCVAE